MFPSKFIFSVGINKLIHFQLISVYHVNPEGSNFSVQVDIQLSQHQLLKELFFARIKCLDILVKNQLTINILVYFWTLSFIPLVYMYILCRYHHGDVPPISTLACESNSQLFGTKQVTPTSGAEELLTSLTESTPLGHWWQQLSYQLLDIFKVIFFPEG